MKFIRALAVAMLFLSFGAPLHARTPYVVVTIKPIYALVAAIMEGVGEPHLLLPDGASPHTFQLKPSTLKQLQRADLIIWVGPQFEMFMKKPIKEYPPRLGLITLLDIPTLKLLPLREGRAWQHDHDHSHGDENTDHHVDPHFWLSTQNAQAVVVYLTTYLAKVDPEHATQYKNNAEKLIRSIKALRSSINQTLQNVHTKPFLVYHDGYQYFEKEFNLNAMGTMIVNPNVPLSANAVNTIAQLIESHDIRCVFRETEFNDNTILHSLRNLNVKVAELDPLGARLALTPSAYQEILKELAKTLKECLDQTPNSTPTKSTAPNH